jgi:hypothetical protein
MIKQKQYPKNSVTEWDSAYKFQSIKPAEKKISLFAAFPTEPAKTPITSFLSGTKCKAYGSALAAFQSGTRETILSPLTTIVLFFVSTPSITSLKFEHIYAS